MAQRLRPTSRQQHGGTGGTGLYSATLSNVGLLTGGTCLAGPAAGARRRCCAGTGTCWRAATARSLPSVRVGRLGRVKAKWLSRQELDGYIIRIDEELPVIERNLIIGRSSRDDRVVIRKTGVDCHSVIVISRRYT